MSKNFTAAIARSSCSFAVYRCKAMAVNPSELLKVPALWADQKFRASCRMDLPHRYSDAPELAVDLVLELLRQGVDVNSCDSVPNTISGLRSCIRIRH